MDVYLNRSEKVAPVLTATGIILIVSSLFMPIVIIFLLHDMLYFDPSLWFFTTPPSGYVLFGAGVLWLGIGFLVIAYLFSRAKKRILIPTAVVFVLGCIPFFILGTDTYYYADENGLSYNKPFTLNQTSEFEWTSLQKVTEVYEKGSFEILSLIEYRFMNEKNEGVILPASDKVRPAITGFGQSFRNMTFQSRKSRSKEKAALLDCRGGFKINVHREKY